MTLGRTTRLRPDGPELRTAPLKIDVDALIGRADAIGVRLGDVLVSEAPAGALDLDRVHAAVVGSDVLVRRDEVISDVYSSRFGDRLLELGGGRRSHHLQLRRYFLYEIPVLQVACYPEPPSAHGLRLWCDPAVVWLFVGSADHEPLDRLLAALQPHWERLLAHHGVPLDRPVEPDLDRRYPVPHRVVPLRADQLVELHAAVGLLVTQEPVRTLIDETLTPRAAVDATLDARRALLQHMDRLDMVLEHSHGAARDKYRAMERFTDLLAGPVETGQGHLLAPHRHLVDGLEETRQHVQRAVVAATETTSLITSAAVGRLLDRSDANRRTTTAVATMAFLLALASTFSALAAIPRDDRLLRGFVQLGAWLSFGALLLLGGAYALARLSAMPSHRIPRRLASCFRGVWPVAALAGAALLAVAGVTGSMTALAVGAGLAVTVAFLRGAIDDY